MDWRTGSPAEGTASIIKSATNFCWFFFKWGLALLLLVALVAVPYGYRKVFFRVEEEVRERMEAKIGEFLPHLRISIHSVRLADDQIEVRGLSISEPEAEGPQAELVYIEQAFIFGRTGLKDLVCGQPLVTHVRLVRPVVRGTYRPDGTSTLTKLLPAKVQEHAPPPIAIESGLLQIFDPLKNPSSLISVRDIHVQIRPTDQTSETGGPLVSVSGEMTADHVQRIAITGTVDPVGRLWSVTGNVDSLALSPELRNDLPGQFSEPLEALKALRARAAIRFRASGGTGDTPLDFVVDGSVSEGRLQDPLLPYPLTDLKADFHADRTGFRVTGLTARDGPTIWEVVEFDRQGFEDDSPFFVRLHGKQVHLDDKWESTLPEPWCIDFRNYAPVGDVDIDCVARFDGQRLHPTLEVRSLNNISFSCSKFPYRLEQCRGAIKLADNVLSISIVGHSGIQPVTLRGSFRNPGPQFTGSIEIFGDKLQFDERLFGAILKPKARETLRSLNPREGTFNVYARIWRDDPRIPELHQFAKITVNRCAITYDKFPVTLTNLQGVLHLNDGQWNTHGELVGMNSTGVVTLSGRLTTSPIEDELQLTINAKSFPLHEELREALAPGQRQLWDSLQPYGKVDLHAQFSYNSRTAQRSFKMRAFPRDDAGSLGTSIEPVAFPYRMRIQAGSIYYHDGHAELENIQAAHRNTRLRTRGTCDLYADGGWQLKLRDLTVTPLRLQGEDRELETALPEALKHAVNELKPTGTINLSGAVDFARFPNDLRMRTSWDVGLSLYQASIQVGPKLENIFGYLRLTGASDGTRYTSGGELDLDSLTYKNFQVTKIRGPLWLDNNNVFLGNANAVPTKAGVKEPRRITAELLGGTLAGDCQVRLGPVPHYHLVATLAQADLGQFARENLAGHQKVNGKILANIDLHGNGGSRNLAGTGNVHLTDADVYELPVMVALLKIVRAKRPDTTAFTQSDINFEIQREHIVLNQINLNGDAISLSGQGLLTLDGQTNPINLQLHTSVGRADLPLLSGAFSAASQQIMQIYVEGTLDHPTTRTEAFPVAKGALQQLQADYEKPRGSTEGGGIMRAIGIKR